MTELVKLICKAGGRNLRLVTDTTKPEGRRVKSSDSTLLRRAYPGFSPRVGLDQGIGRLIGCYRSTFARQDA